MKQDNIPTFERLDYRYAQLFSWIEKDPSQRAEVTKKIIDMCESKRATIEKEINGEFEFLSFSWGNVPGTDSYIFLSFFKDYLDINNVEKANIIKYDEKTIKVLTAEKSAEIILGENEELATLEIHDSRTSQSKVYNLRVKKENGKLIIYKNILDKDSHIRFPNLKFNLNFDKREIVCIARIRINPCIKLNVRPFYSKIWVIISTISSFSAEEKDEFFEIITQKAKDLCDITAKRYIDSLGGATKESSVHNIKIISMGSIDERLMDLMQDRNNLNRLVVKLNSSDYLNEIFNTILTSSCGKVIKNWRGHLSDDCIIKADWKLITSEKTNGLCVTRQENNSTITSSIFYTSDPPNYKSIDDILHTWSVDLSVTL